MIDYFFVVEWNTGDKYMMTLEQWLFEKLDNYWSPNGPTPWAVMLFGGIALVLSILLCGLIGLEREKRGRSAGLRTHLLVGVGSTIIMIVSIYGFPSVFGEHRDVARLAAQVIAGVGFLGAGAIIHRNSGVRGLTTAGTIWIVMAIGLACGSFNFILALVGTLLIILVLTLFKKFEVRLSKKNPTILITADPSEPLMDKILKVSKEFECTIHGLNIELVDDGDALEAIFQVVFSNTQASVEEYMTSLKKETNAITVQLLDRK